MKINVTETTMVKPKAETPGGSLWLSDLDLIQGNRRVPSVHFYRHNGEANFFDAAVLKTALSRVLVPFYPAAGRLRRDQNGRIEIDCNGEGVLFVEANTEATLDDLGDFTPTPGFNGILIPADVDWTKEISTYPMLAVQVTHFKCGGVSLGMGLHHYLVDGISATNFINAWSDIARGLDVVVPPFLDRTLIRPRNTGVKPKFSHIEFQPAPTLKNPQDAITETSAALFKLTRDQLDNLKFNCNIDKEKNRTYTSYEVLAGHVWRCVCQARGLPEDQETWMLLICDGRSRLKPQIPFEFLGNVVFPTVVVSTYGELQSDSLGHIAGKVHEAIVRMDNDYLNSILNYWEVQPEHRRVAGPDRVRCRNFGLTSWARLPFYDADFGWGRPIFVGPGVAPPEGKGYLMPSPTSDGSLLLMVTLPKPQMTIFKKLLYDM